MPFRDSTTCTSRSSVTATCVRNSRPSRDPWLASVTFTGNLDQPTVGAAVAAADVVAVPSVVDDAGNVDGLPTTLLEALSTGRPVVASALAGIPEVLVDRVNGLLTPEKDVDALVAALAQLRDQPQLRDQLGREARRRALVELDWSATAEAFEQAYLSARARQRG